jgi:IS30 family transposase
MPFGNVKKLKTDSDKEFATYQELDMILDRLNNLPSKRLRFKTPNQQFLLPRMFIAIRRWI